MLKGLVSASTKALGGSRFSLLNVLPATVSRTAIEQPRSARDHDDKPERNAQTVHQRPLPRCAEEY
ncbi:hypothetical protein AB0D59_35170 [Streptomyces sp. NPDC048417]|uniref:hypothetical protein n=1 Tax=Streptomyces sp. NPDC048417 TaxID=3155387 RepID=UPI00343B4751